MHGKALRTGLGLAAAAGLVLAGSATASADQSDGRHGNQDRTVTVFKLDELNDSGARGIGVVKLNGNQADVRIFASGLLADHPHAQHFHIGGAGQCPTSERDTNGDGIVSTVEGQPDYGSIGTSLTTSGDTSPASGLAVDRFPTAPNGFVRYDRTITVNDESAQNLRAGNAVIVLHGIDANNSGTYDGDAPSELNPALPLEATAPAACGNQTVLVGAGADRGLGLNLGLNLFDRH
ncbi:hypothetical protein SAMN05216266_101598 [Amycolatopsis marina]|uniref:CHRD domain-containing protein n=1 Tax=Amycolatopsis marina TaxID=490629 RepID=A0A1I0VYR2_9PSEU|nr:hypothetical protein [Amycolatopsis marina]SFA81424.1 hypothetical protein SAMN05216266_101598 [Amycolatopsis marina]